MLINSGKKKNMDKICQYLEFGGHTSPLEMPVTMMRSDVGGFCPA
jgi:hypothetical protein